MDRELNVILYSLTSACCLRNLVGWNMGSQWTGVLLIFLDIIFIVFNSTSIFFVKVLFNHSGEQQNRPASDQMLVGWMS